MMRWTWALALVAVLTIPPTSASARQGVPPGDLANLFFDCQAPGCQDLDFLRREIPFVNWVRDREAANVHVIVTSQATGGGGRQYTLDFIGLGAFEGDDQQLGHATSGDATSDEQRNAISEKLKLGLVRYVVRTSAADRLRVTMQAPGGPDGPGPGGQGGATGAPQEDPWDFWTFRFNGNGFVNGEATSRFANYFGSLRADRTTEAWKINLSANFSENVQEFDLTDENDELYTVRETRRDWGMSGTLVRSVGPQWAIGIRSDAGSSTYLNQDFRVSVMPGVEYDFVPYAESSRRSITLQYLVGPNYFAYDERTIFDELYEARIRQTLTGRLSLVQPWGRWTTALTGAQYLHDLEQYSVTVSGNFNVRLFRGFSIRMSGNYSWIRDQLHISSEGATPEEVLLQQRQLATNYRYFTSFGIEYRFGSIFNNVVNPRFGGGDEFFFF